MSQKSHKYLFTKDLTSYIANVKANFRKFVEQSYIKIALIHFSPLNKI